MTFLNFGVSATYCEFDRGMWAKEWDPMMIPLPSFLCLFSVNQMTLREELPMLTLEFNETTMTT